MGRGGKKASNRDEDPSSRLRSTSVRLIVNNNDPSDVDTDPVVSPFVPLSSSSVRRVEQLTLSVRVRGALRVEPASFSSALRLSHDDVGNSQSFPYVLSGEWMANTYIHAYGEVGAKI